jgi:hypothetical protein
VLEPNARAVEAELAVHAACAGRAIRGVFRQGLGGTNRSLFCFQAGQRSEEQMTDDLRKKTTPDRSKISMSEEHEVRYWTKHLGVTREELQEAVDKVGNAAAAVRKELGK